ncbi:MAG: hypothetical protein GWP19_00435 [Planctomycetia bacterium]|nr:hypothetical protein [Planctomycetia bacterium]
MPKDGQYKEYNPVFGQVYLWKPDPFIPSGGKIIKSTVELLHLDKPKNNKYKLSGRYVIIKNVGIVNIPNNNTVSPVPMCDAKHNKHNSFIFEPFNGGGRMDKELFVSKLRRHKNIQAAHFGEVNTYYHIDKIASYIDGLLHELGERSLPQVKVLINAHNAIVENHRIRDGYRGKKSGKWLPFQGGHYRLSKNNLSKIRESNNIAPHGEIHLGPGWRLTKDGALPEFAECKYRCNASHNAGIIYHEYGHHITRHTADFSANRLKAPHRQSNRKSDLDEAFSDYWAAAMLDCPYIWAWHRKHTKHEIHPRSLLSNKDMTEYDFGLDSDPHSNGTIFAAALWDIRKEISFLNPKGKKDIDIVVLKALTIIGQHQDSPYNPTVKGTRISRSGFNIGLKSVLKADKICFNGIHTDIIKKCFKKRSITLDYSNTKSNKFDQLKKLNIVEKKQISSNDKSIKHILKFDPEAIIPKTWELLTRTDLERQLNSNCDCPFSLTAVGDIMLGSRMNKSIKDFGPEYPFYSVYPLLKKSNILIGNLEGPFADISLKEIRNHSYKVPPKNARILRRAGFNIVSMANNHLLDCGRDGVLETFATLKKQGIQYIGAGHDEKDAHSPVIMRSANLKIGLLGYYWNRRTSARDSKPGSAIDIKEQVQKDITNLKQKVDKIVISVHWGIPYERFPSSENQMKAHFAIDSGADILIGHHPHIIQPIEIYKNRPIFYSIGNFAFGSGNSNAESIILAFNFKKNNTTINIFPVYIKNRDTRINYQPKIIKGESAFDSIIKLKNLSGKSGVMIRFENGVGKIKISHVGRLK